MGKRNPLPVARRVLPPLGARVGSVDGPGVFPSDNPGACTAHVVDRWGAHAVIEFDDGRITTCHGLNTGPGIGFHLLKA